MSRIFVPLNWICSAGGCAADLLVHDGQALLAVVEGAEKERDDPEVGELVEDVLAAKGCNSPHARVVAPMMMWCSRSSCG